VNVVCCHVEVSAAG